MPTTPGIRRQIPLQLASRDEKAPSETGHGRLREGREREERVPRALPLLGKQGLLGAMDWRMQVLALSILAALQPARSFLLLVLLLLWFDVAATAAVAAATAVFLKFRQANNFA